jgi:hypothetical protein
MAFTTLEDKFNQVSAQIYTRFAPSSGQLVTINPASTGNKLDSRTLASTENINAAARNTLAISTVIKDDSRLLPVVSTVRDTVRVSKFLSSPRGVLFIAKQTLLQTGNTFAESRLYNPASPLIAGVPGIPRIPRQLGLTSLKTLLNTVTNGDLGVYRGALQNETVDRLVSKNDYKQVLKQIFTQNPVSSAVKALFVKPEINAGYYVRPEDKVFYIEKRESKYISRLATTALTYTNNSTTPKSIAQSTIVGGFGPALYNVQPLGQRGSVKNTSDRVSGNSFLQKYRTYANQYGNQPYTPDTTNTQDTLKDVRLFKDVKPFKELENTKNTNGYFSGNIYDIITFDPTVVKTSNSSSIVDPLNLPPAVSASSVVPKYQNISYRLSDRTRTEYPEGTKSDIIKFSFEVFGKSGEYAPVHFRAFISSLKETVKPEFSEQRYLGRTERFVTYGGAKRTVNMSFNVVAFSEKERSQVWAKINYLTGLAYPSGTKNGFMIPPLFNTTIGGIYSAQPCYIDSLDYTFINEDIIFDLDAEVPTVVDVNMSIVLLEKRSQFYDSSFYEIENQRIVQPAGTATAATLTT